MKIVLLLLARWLCVLVVTFSAAFLTMHYGRRTNWYKDHLFQQLNRGDARQRLHAASVLAQVGGERQLLDGLKADVPEVHTLARRALEHLWFSAAGTEAYALMESACQAVEQEEFKEALRILDRVTARYPHYAEGWNRRAEALWHLGRYAESRGDCERALELNPNHYGAWQGIGICHLQLGDLDEACRSLRCALSIAPHEESTRRALQKCEELRRACPPAERQHRSTKLL